MRVAATGPGVILLTEEECVENVGCACVVDVDEDEEESGRDFALIGLGWWKEDVIWKSNRG